MWERGEKKRLEKRGILRQTSPAAGEGKGPKENLGKAQKKKEVSVLLL